MFILVYIDDLTIAIISKQEAITTLLYDLRQNFSLKDLENRRCFLGIVADKMWGMDIPRSPQLGYTLGPPERPLIGRAHGPLRDFSWA